MTAPAIERRLDRLWSDAPGVPGFFNTVDHKRIGKRYLVTALIFLVLGGLQAMVIRMQLAVPNNALVDPETYNRLFTMHGTTMIFLFNTPIIAAFGNYLLPLQIGARDMAFPRLNALSYWIYLLAGIFLYASFAVGQVPNTGWFAYVPLSSEQAYTPGLGLDFWALGVVFIGISTTVGGINFIVTTFKMRAPGMTVARMPIFVWAILVTSFLIIFALPAITLGPLLMEFDRALGTSFYDPAAGGDPLLYQHLFWFWGHPEVYILFIPATGLLSMIIPVEARRRLAGYTWAVASLVAIGFVSFGVWVHHMFAVGLPDLANSFFSAAGLVIAIPSAIQVFVWIATLWTGRPRWSAALLFSVGAIIIFVMGGVTGVMVSMVPFDWQATDSYFVVAHFHYVLNGGVLFPILAALYFYGPKVTGWLLNERLGKLSFWLSFIGFHLLFFPQHILGLYGMPRRVFTFHAGLGWDALNMLSSVGAFVFATGVGLTLVNLGVSWRRRNAAGPNPWQADSLEWATTSPPQEYNFADLPVVRSRHPLWDEVHHEGRLADPDAEHMLDPDDPEHETQQTAGLEARWVRSMVMPAPSYWPFLLALSVAAVFCGMLLRSLPLGLVGVALAAANLIGWHWDNLSEGLQG